MYVFIMIFGHLMLCMFFLLSQKSIRKGSSLHEGLLAPIAFRFGIDIARQATDL